MSSNGTYKVYLIDDDEDEFLLFQQAIAELNINIQVRYINNCAEMLDLLDKGDIPDLLFLDLNMPMISGRECVKKIREKLKDKLSIVIYSTSKYQPDVDGTHQDGANLYVIKPNSFEGLKQTLNGVFSIDWKHKFYLPSREKYLFRL
ncbi:MAG TPA: response regulator [Flavitalea sp.]|nr:response regulator [Flavitalea sp.]